MSEIGPVNGTIADHSATRRNHIRESMLLTLVLYSVVRATQALAGEQPLSTDSALKDGAKNSRETQTAGTSMFSAPFVSARPLNKVEAYSDTEFRPRKRGLDRLESARSQGSIIDTPMLQGTSIWQQLAQYRSQDRVRLLTLWQTKGSSLSLQAGRHGVPSLQWSTPWAHHEGAARGLLDRLLTVPPRTGSSNSHVKLPRPASTPTAPKSLD
jgi:hypothetical protein